MTLIEFLIIVIGVSICGLIGIIAIKINKEDPENE